MWWTAKDVGVYAAILKTVGILSVMVSLLATSTFPLFSRLAAHNRKQLGYLLERMFRILGVIAFPLIAGGIVVAPQLLTLLFGSDYISGIGPFTLLLFSILATYPLTILMNVVFACDVQRRTMYMPFVAAGISVALNLLLIPPFGVWGAVIAMVISNFVYTTLLFRVVNTLVPFTFASFLVVPMIASVVMGLGAAILSMIHIHVIIVIFLSVAVYFAMLFLFRDATLQETLKLIRNQ
jgi:O-antigen/teichoic acid export membrane protein